ncbi:SDR family NAD(P)-dependent oxidoreductase [Mycolicibacterium hodleri]|uniref:SDR family NAD(P)-dependent oxidoreductase n=1 Tax=Mycolicibacterium hodleri TaxID=49897 RepID=A0A502EDJ0_9MYCO|nr:SDR family NAD(P)-dependent oxidoreductase [Mycolicibacterium hodleri]TPG35763.1 SDR family NAD(P)-dependent oxidoreductase [Mycolicibacterium hodleri]
MTGRTIVITGASDGIGAAAAKRLSRSGEHVVVVGRSPQKTAAVAADIGADHFLADFSELAQVHRLADELLSHYPRIDVLANNAGGIMGERQVTVDGHEKTFQVNHLAPFLLTTLLIDRLVESKASVLNTSSVGNKLFGRVDVDDLESERGYRSQKAYGTTKLENILFTKELDRRYHSVGISTAAFHPGNVASNFGGESNVRLFRMVYRTPLKHLVLVGSERGSDLLVWLASAAPGRDWVTGEYYSGHSVAKANKQAYDADLARELWDRSAAMVATPQKGADS